MTVSYLDQLKQETNTAYTANGAKSNKSTLNPVLDFFSKAGAMRADRQGAVELFARAYAADPLMAMKALFYLRDVRGGQGERRIFKDCMHWLSQVDIDLVNHLNPLIPEYGRWDDVVVTRECVVMLLKQFRDDEMAALIGEPVSLLAKWLPSENASSQETKQAAQFFMKAFGMRPVEYRKRVVALRKHIKLLEQQMSAKQWSEIDYEKIPSQAHRKHVAAFNRNDEDRYTKYLEAVTAGEKKINVSTLYTYEVFDTIQHNEQAANAMWSNLPDYTNGENAIVLADVSRSMSGRPMSISVSLALYFAERNTGPFKNCFMTFTDQPEVVEVLGDTLSQKLSFIESSRWGYNTDLGAALQAILNAAVLSECSQEELPKVLYIISDMQFDSATNHPNETNFQAAKRSFREAGYEMPHIVFWNCHATGDDSPATMFDNNVTLISGSSQSTFQYAVAGKTPLESMNDILNSERYAPITLVPVDNSEQMPF
jgi:hypothetical protein